MDDEEYEQAVEKLLAEVVVSLKSARGDSTKIKETIEEYLKRGDSLDMSPMELRDYFDISTPGLHEQAGYTEEECDLASDLFTKVSDARYSNT